MRIIAVYVLVRVPNLSLPLCSTVEYVELQKSGSGVREEKRRFLIHEYPSELHKKVTLLKHFRNYLMESGTEVCVTICVCILRSH